MLNEDCCLRKGGNHAISGRVCMWRAQFSPFTIIVLFLAASSKRTVRVRERLTVDPRCVLLGGYYCIHVINNRLLAIFTPKVYVDHVVCHVCVPAI